MRQTWLVMRQTSSRSRPSLQRTSFQMTAFTLAAFESEVLLMLLTLKLDFNIFRVLEDPISAILQIHVIL